MGELIELDDGRRAYLALPAEEGAPGIVLLHAWWGLNSFTHELADRLAEQEFAVLAPDYYGGETAESIEEAKRLRGTIDRPSVNKGLRGALHYLADHPAVDESHIGAIGFSLGVGFTLELARAEPQKVDAVVLFYGTGGGRFDRVQASFLGHFAEHDRWGADAKKVQSLEERLTVAGHSVVFHTYPGTEHWFFESDRKDAFHPQAAQFAWERTLEFLRRTLY